MKTPKVDTRGTDEANRAIAEAQRAANNLSKNFQADLATDNLTTVVAGGGAEAALAPSGNRRKRTGSALSSTLNIG